MAADLPPLTDDLLEALELEIQKKKEELGLTGEHSHWPESRRIDRTLTLAISSFGRIAGVYLLVWHAANKPHREFVAWMVAIKSLIITEHLRPLWANCGDWFERVCLPKVDAELDDPIREWSRKTREFRLKQIESRMAPG
jgi:hypothetical protein